LSDRSRGLIGQILGHCHVSVSPALDAGFQIARRRRTGLAIKLNDGARYCL
jgi:hypothetical protein